MARDLSDDIDRLTSQLADLRSALAKQASSSADDASSYILPRARQVARQFRHSGNELTEVVRRNPGTTTGAIFGALALTAAFAFLLSKAGSDR
jgi:type VI protein secretion system component VasF